MEQSVLSSHISFAFPLVKSKLYFRVNDRYQFYADAHSTVFINRAICLPLPDIMSHLNGNLL